jgi:hypothetical protein
VVAPSEAACQVLFIGFQKSCPVYIILAQLFADLSASNLQLLKYCKLRNGAHEAVQNRVHVHLRNHIKTEQERCLGIFSSSALISFEMKSVLA